ncbi:hypothetical protein BO71DRAFT_426402 [Aspergillus ellipticus CBS 707.79]|uniref:Uncharacterized protein n=1 Tax=Aspergillus ellipticus CBS 707.79 TaxID=1448320 RepID=A0A319F0R1_9EURO|nr:hypothetical protein BO71DRAFT_426402 [Aspergillus ellipticus CBS 707.79]
MMARDHLLVLSTLLVTALAVLSQTPLTKDFLDCSPTPGDGMISYESVCPPAKQSGTITLQSQKFSYKCEDWASTDDMKAACAASTWYARGKKGFLLEGKYSGGTQHGYLLLKKEQGSTDPGTGVEVRDHEKLKTKALCPEFNMREFLFTTPSGAKTRWRIYCDHRITDIPNTERGIMNGTSTPYSTLLASRHWDAGFRALAWNDRDSSYKHLTVYHLLQSQVPRTLRDFYLRYVPTTREHVIARVDQHGLQFH